VEEISLLDFYKEKTESWQYCYYSYIWHSGNATTT